MIDQFPIYFPSSKVFKQGSKKSSFHTIKTLKIKIVKKSVKAFKTTNLFSPAL